MNYDELAFFNQQLAAMLRDGIPLEGALKQLCTGMKAGPLRHEMAQLEADLARGTPLKEALTRRSLPEFYLRMVDVGARSNDLPGMLTLLADYYQRANAVWNRLKGLMVYPFLVVLVSFGLTLVLALVFNYFVKNLLATMPLPAFFIMSAWLPPVIFGLLTLAGLAIVWNRRWRGKLRWRLPAFREASLSQLASTMALMLKNGVPLADALALAESTESNSPAGKALAQWRHLVETGQGKPALWPDSLPPFPPMFLWLVQKGGEDLAAGFRKAADLYQSRASYRIEMALYGALPISILFVGQMVLWQVAPIFRGLISLMNMLGS